MAGAAPLPPSPNPQDPGSLLRKETGAGEGPLCFGHRIGAVTQVLTRALALGCDEK